MSELYGVISHGVILHVLRLKGLICDRLMHVSLKQTQLSLQVEIEVGENVYRMRQNPEQPHLLATGGKQNDLKIWDLQRPDEAVFKAKNVITILL